MSSSVPRRLRPGNSFDSSTTSANPASIPPTPDGATFRDLLIFEERLKQNAARLQRRKHKYQGILLLLCSSILLLSYHVLLFPKPQHPLVHYAQLVSLVVCGTTVFLFFASGMYAERIVAANRFVPQANRALRPFNMYLNTRRPHARDGWLASLPFLGSAATGEYSSISTSSPLGTPSRSTHFPLPSSPASSTRLVRDPPDPANPTVVPPLRRLQIQPIPPSSNPRGEMIFSSKVSPAFREGYERYRNAFERRRKEKLDAAEMEGRMRWRWRRWLFALRGGRNIKQLAGEKGLEAGGTTSGSGMGTPTTSRRPVLGEKSSGSGNTTSSRTRATSGGSSAGGGQKRGSSRQQSHRSRTDSSASIASTASNSTRSSALGHNGSGDANLGVSDASSISLKRKSSPRRKLRELPPIATSSSLEKNSSSSEMQEKELQSASASMSTASSEKVEEQKHIHPDPAKVADRADWRGDATATLREPSSSSSSSASLVNASNGQGKIETDVLFVPPLQTPSHHDSLSNTNTNTNTNTNQQATANDLELSITSLDSSEDEGEGAGEGEGEGAEEEEDVDRSLVDLGSLSIPTSPSSSSSVHHRREEKEGQSPDMRGEGSSSLTSKAQAQAQAQDQEMVARGLPRKGEEGWVEVRRSADSTRR